MRDPRSHRRYRTARITWLRTADPTCALCGKPIDTSLPGTHPWGPTVEHTVPVRTILDMSETFAQALDMVCDTSLWAAAHVRCQQLQGASAGGRIIQARNRARAVRRGSRDW